MSYEIDKWKTKKLNNLVIPLKSFYESERTDWHPEQPLVINTETMEVKLKCGGDQHIKGILKDGLLTVTEFEMYGEGSGNFMHYVLYDAFRQSAGELEAILVWEGGDSITRLIVNDGVLTEEEIEL